MPNDRLGRLLAESPDKRSPASRRLRNALNKSLLNSTAKLERSAKWTELAAVSDGGKFGLLSTWVGSRDRRLIKLLSVGSTLAEFGGFRRCPAELDEVSDEAPTAIMQISAR